MNSGNLMVVPMNRGVEYVMPLRLTIAAQLAAGAFAGCHDDVCGVSWESGVNSRMRSILTMADSLIAAHESTCEPILAPMTDVPAEPMSPTDMMQIGWAAAEGDNVYLHQAYPYRDGDKWFSSGPIGGAHFIAGRVHPDHPVPVYIPCQPADMPENQQSLS